MLIFRQLVIFAVTLVLFVAVDLVWIGGLMKTEYQKALAGKSRMSHGVMAPLWVPAALVWVLIVLGIMLLVLPLSGSIGQAAWYGGIYGFILYGVYDLTNYATLADWPLSIVLYDIGWGTFINAVASAFAFYLASMF